MALRGELVDLLLTRSTFSGTAGDLDRAMTVAAEAVALAPTSVPALTLRARVEGAVHAFAAARDDLATLATLGADTGAQLATLDLATGADLSAAADYWTAAMARDTSFRTLAGLAAVRSAQGRWAEADALYVWARDTYRDVSPFPIAWIAFQRGVMWAEKAGDAERGRVLYEEAVRHLPTYVVANVHLAELEAEEGDVAGAITRLKSLLEVAPDPEPRTRLAELVPDPAEAARYAAEATAIYDDLLARWPAAFADHAAEHFMGPGADPARALALARGNLETRSDDRAWQLALDAALAAGDRATACRYAHQAGAGRPSVPLAESRAAALEACGRHTAVLRLPGGAS